MATEDKAANKAHRSSRARARRKPVRPSATSRWKPKASVDQAKGNLKQAGEKVKDAFKK